MYVTTNREIWQHFDVVVPVRPCLFMPKSYHVTEFVKKDAVLHAASLQSHLLGSLVHPPHVRATSGGCLHVWQLINKIIGSIRAKAQIMW